MQDENDNLRHVISVSGGKDSTAMWLLALERGVKAQAVFADTGNECQQTYDYVDYLEQTLGLRPTGNPFLDLCMLKGRFPSTRVRFCSQELKHIPIRANVFDPLMDEGFTVVSWQGVRADESRNRAVLDIVEQMEDQLIAYRPIITWTAEQVFDQHRKYGIRWNPLYEQNMGRVGCMPCIHSRKSEISEISRRFPDEIHRIAEWEKLVKEVSPLGITSFFSSNKTTQDYGADDSFGIEHVVKWSKTTRGGKNFDLLFDVDDATSCSSIYGLCE